MSVILFSAAHTAARRNGGRIHPHAGIGCDSRLSTREMFAIIVLELVGIVGFLALSAGEELGIAWLATIGSAIVWTFVGALSLLAVGLVIALFVGLCLS